MTRTMKCGLFGLAAAAAMLVPAVTSAQRGVRRQQTIEIRGQVPTPQVVTVRPREVPTYSRQVLVPEFYDRDFWQSILPAYQLVQRRSIEGVRPTDSSQVIATPVAPVALGVPVVTPRTPGAAAALTSIDPTLPPEERARRAEIAAALLVMLQPDLGTGLAICFGAGVVIFLAGLPMSWFIGAGGAGLVLAPIAFFTLLHDYQRKRVFVFLDPESDPLGDGYHITQSKIAIGSGGFSGKGFGNGSQSALGYLPEKQTDFVFATMAEQWGLLGGLFTIGVFILVLTWGIGVATRAQDRFASLLAAGMTATVFFYMAINLMMVMGLAPVVGIPLPFMSHGGSSMLTNMICIGTIMAVDRWSRRGRSLGD